MQSILSVISSELASREKQHAVSKRICLGGDRDPNILVSSDGLKLSMLVIVKKTLAL